MKEFEPKIVCFLCQWCTYAGADFAGTSRLKYPPNGVVIKTLWPPPFYYLNSFLNYLFLDITTANRTQDAAINPDQHLGTLLPRSGTTGGNDSRQGCLFSLGSNSG